MDDYVLPSKLLLDLSKAADIVRSHDYIHVFSHYDADGISAAAILAHVLLREGKEFKVTLFPTLADSQMEVVRQSNAKCILLSDLGASYISELERLDADVIVLDHHTIGSVSEKVCYSNPHLYGIDGMTSGCGATMAFLFGITMNEKNWDLVQVAFAGIAGDRQHVKGLLGLNKFLIKGAVERGFVEVSDGSLIPPGELTANLFLSTDPYVRGVSGSVEGVAKILEDAKIPSAKHFGDLTDEEKRKLTSLMAIKLTEQGVSLQTMTEVSRTRYILKDWDMDAEDLASIFNGCGRTGQYGLSIGAGLKDTECLEEARNQELQSRKQTIEAVLELEKTGLTPMKNIQWFDSSSYGFSGMVCGIAMQFIGDPTKPTISVNSSEDLAKVSSRGTWWQLDNGVDLAVALKDSCEKVGGKGGGHKIASGGSFDPSKVQEFLSVLDETIGKQKINGAK